MSQFHQRRRQQFLTEKFYTASVTNFSELSPELKRNLEGPSGDTDDKRGWAFYLCDDAYRRFSLLYTAGEPLEALRAELDAVIQAYERYQKALETHEQIHEIAPLGLRRIDAYERCMQLIGLCYLLHRRDLLPRIAALQDPAYAGEDALYEDILAYELEGRFETSEMFHLETYDPLLHAMYSESDEESVDDIKRYVKAWYPAFKYAPWHDGHLRINGTDGDYFGYWAFEAGAVAYLLDLDDSSIDHMVYPKDLVAWARTNKHLSQESDDDVSTRLRCEAGQPCPREGYWFTPAQAGSRRLFKAGELMPEVKSDYGATIWQWDANQG